MTLILSGTDGLSDIDGSAATPAVRGTDANTGIFFGTDIIGFSEGGTEVARFNADAQFVAAAGTASLPVITTTGDVNTGIFFPAADTIAFSEGGAEAMRIDSSGNVLVGLTSATSGGGVLQVSNGITFPATQSASSNANTLDDYEEGTFTPTVTFGGGSATVASSAAYIKIGKTCFVNGYVSFSSVSSASAGSITNFPFTAATISGSPRQVLVAREDAATGKMGQVYISAATTTAALQDYAGANAGTVFANGYTWIFTGTYNTSA